MNLEDCKSEVIERAFPEVRAVSIITRFHKMPDAYLEFTRLSRKRYLLDVNTSLKNAKRKVILGGMGHEIAHISREISLGPVLSFFDAILYNRFPRYETRDERRTDLLVIERGLCPELLAFLKYANERREDYTAEDGLTVREVESLLRQRASNK